MHGQKKRRKRTLQGSLDVEGYCLCWELLSEPQWTSEHGYKGLCISVRTADHSHRELVLEYPIPNKRTGNGLLQLPQRPNISIKAIEAGVRRALTSGWEPESRGKLFVFKIGEDSE